MAILKNGHTGELCLLRAHHLFGRDDRHCDTYLNHPSTSRLHASIRWQAGQWILQDHSRNGTRLAEQRLANGMRAALHAGDLIQFGLCPILWLVHDLADPLDQLWPLHSPATPIRLSTEQALTSRTEAAWLCYHHATEQWHWHNGQTTLALHDGQELLWENHRWRLHLRPREDTLWQTQTALAPPRIATPHIRFQLSQDEEHACAQLDTGQQVMALGERVHHYCLATLARLRYAGQQAGHDASSQGWVDLAELARMLGLPAAHINIQMHRARQQLQRLQRPEADWLLERRRGGVRFGALAFQVFRGDTLECQWQPDHATLPTDGPDR